MATRNSKGQFIKGSFPIKPFSGKERVGQKNSENQKRMVRKALRGKKLSLEHKNKLRLAKLGEKQTPEHVRIRAEAMRRNPRPRLTPINTRIRMSQEYKLWREAVFARDNWTCVFCFKRGEILQADHIKPFAKYPELRLAIDNGRTLCKPCHMATDTYLKNYKKKT